MRVGRDPSSVATTPPSATSTESADVSGPVIDDRFAVGAGYELEMRCYGEGSPVIIFEAGTDGSGLEEYAALMRPLAERTMVCTYDRPGYGQSDPPSSERRRTLDDTATNLHDLAEAAGLAPPFLLAGASGGGLLVVNYAGRYPDQVAGVVLLDVPAPNKDLDKEMPGAMGWRNPEHLDYVAAERTRAAPAVARRHSAPGRHRHERPVECEGSVVLARPLIPVAANDGRRRTRPLQEYPDVVIPEIQSALDAIQG